MPTKCNAITGAAGFLGSHIAKRLIARGQPVRALVRAGTDASQLADLGVELVRGDLSDVDALAALLRGANVVYHCAAKTGNWGTWSSHVAGSIDATRNVVVACHNSPCVERLLHVSSVAVYGHPRVRSGQQTREEDRLGQNLWLWDHYTRAKIAAEEIVRQLRQRATIIRPTWIYGPRDGANIPAALRAVRQRRAWLIGSGNNLLNMVFVGHVAEAAIRAANDSIAKGQVYNVCSDGQITQRQMIDMICDAIGVPRVRRRVPYAIVHGLGFCAELQGRLTGQTRKPFITRHGMSVYVRSPSFSSEKAKRELGVDPESDTRERFAETLRWFLANQVK